MHRLHALSTKSQRKRNLHRRTSHFFVLNKKASHARAVLDSERQSIQLLVLQSHAIGSIQTMALLGVLIPLPIAITVRILPFWKSSLTNCQDFLEIHGHKQSTARPARAVDTDSPQPQAGPSRPNKRPALEASGSRSKSPKETDDQVSTISLSDSACLKMRAENHSNVARRECSSQTR